AGAKGIMQVMPPTAQWLAKVDPSIDAACITNLENPDNSFRLGIGYLLRMVERSSGNLVHALASYNAGPGNCSKWLKKWPKADLETFVENIPFGETRNYVKTVLGAYAAYHSLYPAAD
ncbi:MAG: lytic transglycosylase domain-containing protein, partial [Candidatus Hydrogenedentes bacterium]|nr:lytic transglycosylase domain-containing protein [Candidatus Hydrogenedentota bacterium]